jgi:uncharacterized repeat protein (TIGR01451 family)
VIAEGANATGSGDGAVTITYTEPPLPDLTISKSHTGNFTQGQTGAQYTITVSNVGLGSTSGTVSVVDTLPAGLTATALSGTGWSCSLATLTCTRSDALASGSYPNIILTVNVASNAPSSVTNSATVSGGGEQNTANNTANDPTTVNQAPTAPTCNGQTATIWVNAQGVIQGGPNNGRPYRGKLNGTPGNDVMVGTTGKDEFAARAGSDLICGLAGKDEMEAGGGNDTMTGGTQADKFKGGAGTDTATDFNAGEGDTKTGVEVF